MTEQYSFSLTTFSPSGKLVQIEYALQAVSNGSPSVGIKALDGVVIASEKKIGSVLYDQESVSKVESVCPNIGMVYSGMAPDYRVILKQARRLAQQYQFNYLDAPYLPPPLREAKPELTPPVTLVTQVANLMQEYTQSGGVRPFGVSLLVAGWDSHENRPYLFQCDPSGAFFPWKATALGRNHLNSKSFLEKRYNEEMGVDDAVHTAILALKESFEGEMNEDNIEIGICTADGFRKLPPSEVKDHLAAFN